jgi:hypothetical protein
VSFAIKAFVLRLLTFIIDSNILTRAGSKTIVLLRTKKNQLKMIKHQSYRPENKSIFFKRVAENTAKLFKRTYGRFSISHPINTCVLRFGRRTDEGFPTRYQSSHRVTSYSCFAEKMPFFLFFHPYINKLAINFHQQKVDRFYKRRIPFRATVLDSLL